MNIRASFLPSNIPWQPGLENHTWFKGFDFNNPQIVRVAQATNEKGEAIRYIRFVRSDDAFLITDFSVLKGASTADAKQACDALDLLLEKQAQLEGVKKLFVIKPGTAECEEVQTYSPIQNGSRFAEVNTTSHVALSN